jgi:hypothetical protein
MEGVTMHTYVEGVQTVSLDNSVEFSILAQM